MTEQDTAPQGDEREAVLVARQPDGNLEIKPVNGMRPTEVPTVLEQAQRAYREFLGLPAR